MRAFFAVALAGPARARGQALLAGLAALPGADAVRWVRPEGLHVTLRFLGDVEAERVEELVARISERTREIPPFALSVGAPAPFPSPRRARVVVAEVAPEAPLRRLAAAVEDGVVAAGFAPETRRFRPHLTLGRLRRGARLPRDFSAGMTAPDTPAGHVSPVSEALLYRSRLQRGGSIYTSIGRAPLASAGEGPVSDHP